MLLLVFILILPPAAVVTGVLMGLLSGLSVGWLFFATKRSCTELVSGPTQAWLETVLLPISHKIDEWRQLDLASPAPEVVIDVNPLLLLTAAASGLIGALITALVYLGLGLLFLFPMMFRMYQANSRLCGSDFKIVEALFACTAYLIQVPLIPVYTLVLTAWQPIEGFVVGFGRVAYSVIFHSNASHMRGSCGCLLNTLGFTGLLPAAAKLGEDINTRWVHGEKRVTRVYERLTQAQEDMLHCFSARVRFRSSIDLHSDLSSRSELDGDGSEPSSSSYRASPSPRRPPARLAANDLEAGVRAAMAAGAGAHASAATGAVGMVVVKAQEREAAEREAAEREAAASAAVERLAAERAVAEVAAERLAAEKRAGVRLARAGAPTHGQHTRLEEEEFELAIAD